MRFGVHDELEKRMEKTIHVLKSELGSVRTGKANPKVLESIYVDYYGSQTPLNQLASISAPEARTLIIKPYDVNSVEAVEKGILKSDLGINPNNDGEKIILNFPMLTEERRKEFSKKVKDFAEEAKIALRNERRDANQELEDMEDNGELTEDDLRRSKETVQEITDKYNDKIDKMLDRKIKEIMEI